MDGEPENMIFGRFSSVIERDRYRRVARMFAKMVSIIKIPPFARLDYNRRGEMERP